MGQVWIRVRGVGARPDHPRSPRVPPCLLADRPCRGVIDRPAVAGLKPGAPAPVPSPSQSRRLGGSRCSGRYRLPPSQVLSGGGRASLRETARSCYAAAHSRRREVASALWADTASLRGLCPLAGSHPPWTLLAAGVPADDIGGLGVREVCASRTCRMVSDVPCTHKATRAGGLHRVGTRPTSGVRRPCLIRRRPRCRRLCSRGMIQCY